MNFPIGMDVGNYDLVRWWGLLRDGSRRVLGLVLSSPWAMVGLLRCDSLSFLGRAFGKCSLDCGPFAR